MPSVREDCASPASRMADGAANRESETSSIVAPFGVSEAGWATYTPLIAHEIGTRCGAQTAAFAAALARWQGSHALSGSGRVDAQTLSDLGTMWLLRRPFVRASRSGCPASPPEASLANASSQDSFGGKPVMARPGALAAYRQMTAGARSAGFAPPLLEIASAYRGPDEEAARCTDGSCGMARKAHCSAHRTGLAFDLYLGAAPGSDPFSASDPNRLFLSKTPVYRWLVENAGRFGFVPYPFEPWHWEWTGEPV